MRARRIADVLANMTKATLEDMEQLQNDVVSLNARRLVALLNPLSSSRPDTRSALRLLTELERMQGRDPALWQWGKLQTTLFEHPLAPMLDATIRSRVNVGPMARGGGPSTANVSAYHPATFQQLHGALFRTVIDVGNWDNSRAINTPGQSGDPGSAHYRDLAAAWANGKYFPLLYSRAAVEQVADEIIELIPMRQPAQKK